MLAHNACTSIKASNRCYPDQLALFNNKYLLSYPLPCTFSINTHRTDMWQLSHCLTYGRYTPAPDLGNSTNLIGDAASRDHFVWKFSK